VQCSSVAEEAEHACRSQRRASPAQAPVRSASRAPQALRARMQRPQKPLGEDLGLACMLLHASYRP